MIDSLLNVLLRCAHRRTTFPMTTWRQPYASSAVRFGKRTYVICLDCGKELSYNWEEMRIEAAEPPADFGIQRLAASWFASLHVLFSNCVINANFSFLKRKASTKVSAARMSFWRASQAAARICGRLTAFRAVLKSAALKIRKGCSVRITVKNKWSHQKTQLPNYQAPAPFCVNLLPGREIAAQNRTHKSLDQRREASNL